MADRVLFIGWNRPVPGREKQALDNLGKWAPFFSKLQADGRIESFETVILEAHGGDLNGFHLVKGNTEQIFGIRQDETYLNLIIEAGYCVQGIGIINGYIGDGITNAMTRYVKLIS
ncbi:MAG: hypothetical protein HY787_06730 [Deltaproteobacteria bacterium]|nr:hypothetical protein [Deltaproteobacteria bacterium]